MSMAKVHRFVHLEQRKRRLKLLTEQNNIQLAEAETEALDYMMKEGAKSVRTDLGTVTHHMTPRARLATDRPETAHGIMRDLGLGDMVKAGVHAGTLSSWVKEQDGVIPDELKPHISVYEHNQLRFRRSS